MNILCLRTDKPIAEALLYKDDKKLSDNKWEGHKQLSRTIHKEIKSLLDKSQLDWQDIEGVVFFAGPGSFTGLRIGASVAGSLAYGLNIPVVNAQGDDWIEKGIKSLAIGEDAKTPKIFYGGDPHITKPRK